MNVQILSVSVSTKTSKAGKNFQNAEVAYKNFDNGKVESKNITQYSKVFKLIVEANPGQTFEVFTEKNEGGYWEWTSMKRVVVDPNTVPTAPTPPTPGAPSPAVSSPVRSSTYETADERAKKQVYIVKQSSIAQAVALLSVGAKTPVKVDDILSVAQQLTDWVFDKKDLFDEPNDLEVVVE